MKKGNGVFGSGLLPCPFCGGRDVWYYGKDSIYGEGIICYGCGVFVLGRGELGGDYKESIFIKWNTRFKDSGDITWGLKQCKLEKGFTSEEIKQLNESWGHYRKNKEGYYDYR